MPFDTRDANRGRGAPKMKLVAGNSNRPLAEAIAGALKLPLCRSVVRRFADMEVFVEVQENMRGEDVYVLHGVLWERFTYLVKAVAEGASALAVKAAADRIRQLLHEQALPIAGYQCQVCRRTQRVRYTEESQDTDQLWQHRGGEYEVLATPLTTSMAP